MLTFEACKALKELGYPQKPGVVLRVADGARFWSDVLTTGLVACPDSVDALDWLAAKYGNVWIDGECQAWFRELTSRGVLYWLSVIDDGSVCKGLTPSDLILEVAKCVSTSPTP